jgi:hypothetical protein
MSRSLNHLRRGVLAAAVLGALGFGTAQAFGTAAPAQRRLSCPALGYDYAYSPCAQNCATHQGYCSATGICHCGQIP